MLKNKTASSSDEATGIALASYLSADKNTTQRAHQEELNLRLKKQGASAPASSSSRQERSKQSESETEEMLKSEICLAPPAEAPSPEKASSSSGVPLPPRKKGAEAAQALHLALYHYQPRLRLTEKNKTYRLASCNSLRSWACAAATEYPRQLTDNSKDLREVK